MAGMKSITDMQERAQALQNGLQSGAWLRDIIVDNEHIIVSMNAQQQLYEQGVNTYGVPIMDYMPYTPYTIEIKTIKHQPTDRVTLRDTGDFHESFYVETTDTQFVVKASDWKTEKLIKKYGRQILGLTRENLQELIWQYVYPELLNKTKATIYGN